jgi:hypothetical protein
MIKAISQAQQEATTRGMQELKPCLKTKELCSKLNTKN